MYCPSNHWHDVCGLLSCKGTFSTDCEAYWWHFAVVKQRWPANMSTCILIYGCTQFAQLGTAKIWLGTRAVVIGFSCAALITINHMISSANASTDVVSIQ